MRSPVAVLRLPFDVVRLGSDLRPLQRASFLLRLLRFQKLGPLAERPDK